MNIQQENILILGGTGKTGRRIVRRLQDLGRSVRVGSRSAEPPFDWQMPETWSPALCGVDSLYISYYPDLAVPGAMETVRDFTDLALSKGIKRIVLLSGRGEKEAERTERMLQASGADWTILRCAWFFQNFSESFLVESVRHGDVILPTTDVLEPFVDAEDIADVAVAALLEDGHIAQLYELTGSRLLTFREAVEEIASVTGRKIKYQQVSLDKYAALLAEQGVPKDFAWLLNYLFTTVLDGRNAHICDGVKQALGRMPRDFSAYVRETAMTGVWEAPISTVD